MEKEVFDFKKIKKLKDKLPNIESKDFERLKENFNLYKKQLRELEKLIQEKEKFLENKDNTKLFESEENYGI
jgi:O-phosphoseryl-tRNA(Cys) synthetase